MRVAAGGLLICQLVVPVALSGDEWNRVQIPDPAIALAIRRTLAEASQRLATPECQMTLTDFHDGEGRPLAERLVSLGVDVVVTPVAGDVLPPPPPPQPATASVAATAKALRNL